MTSIDRELIRIKLEELQDYAGKLEEFRLMPQAEFLADYHHYALAEHFLRLAIETVLDVCRQLVIALELRTPADSHGLFPLLSQNGVLSEQFVDRNRQMPGVRNRLVHVYSQVDHQKIHRFLQEHLADFGNFSAQVSGYLLDAPESAG